LSASRFNRKALERLLYIASGLVILVILSNIIWVIPHVIRDTTPGARPERAAPVFWALVAFHLLILAVLIWKILISRRGGRLRKIGLIIPGIVLILMSMMLIDAAGDFLEHHPDMFSGAILLFICSFCDLMSGVIIIMLPVRLPENQHKTP
jgi:hypothetical protein